MMRMSGERAPGMPRGGEMRGKGGVGDDVDEEEGYEGEMGAREVRLGLGRC